MIAPALFLFASAFGADTEADAAGGIPLPAEALAPVPAAAPAPAIRAGAAPISASVPPPSEPDLLVGREAWLDQKFVVDPLIGSDHGRPTVIFETSDPALRP